MFLFGKKKTEKTEKKTYDHENLIPIIRCSICTGEQVAGFKNRHTGRFQEIQLIRDEEDLREFMRTYDITDIRKEY